MPPLETTASSVPTFQLFFFAVDSLMTIPASGLARSREPWMARVPYHLPTLELKTDALLDSGPTSVCSPSEAIIVAASSGGITSSAPIDKVAVSSTPSISFTASSTPSGRAECAVRGGESTKSAVRLVSDHSLTASFMDTPNMPITVTSASPSVSANDVVPVLRGLRWEFVAASLPTVPKGAPTTRPSPPIRGMDSAGPTSQTEATAITAPTPTKMARILVSASFHCNAQAMIAIAADASTVPVHVLALRLLLVV